MTIDHVVAEQLQTFVDKTSALDPFLSGYRAMFQDQKSINSLG